MHAQHRITTNPHSHSSRYLPLTCSQKRCLFTTLLLAWVCAVFGVCWPLFCTFRRMFWKFWFWAYCFLFADCKFLDLPFFWEFKFVFTGLAGNRLTEWSIPQHCTHLKITWVSICRLTKHYMSYKALYDIHMFITLSVHVMLFKTYPTYICFLSDIYMFLIRHIF